MSEPAVPLPHPVARVHSGVVVGVGAVIIDVEVDLLRKLPSVSTVGLAETSVKESKDRIRSAIANAGFEFPRRRVTVNLAPARLRKTGTAFDLPIAVAVLAAAGEVRARRLRTHVMLGELSLDGSVRGVPGVLPVVESARARGFEGVLVPHTCAAEAAAVDGIEVRSVRHLLEAVRFLNGEIDLPVTTLDLRRDEEPPGPDFADVAGLAGPRRACEIAAAGAHNLLLVGPPGSGKTLLARRIPSILPAATRAEGLEITRVHSVAGLLRGGDGLRWSRPFRAPHHTTSAAGMFGGGSQFRPGEVTLAHRGVLFLDELPEFNRRVLEGLRQPLEDRVLVVARARERTSYPAAFVLVAAMNPCPCGHAGSETPDRCECPEADILRYRARVSGPLRDRFDLSVEVVGADWSTLRADAGGPRESSAQIRVRVMAARERQARRYDGLPWITNAEVPGPKLEELIELEPSASDLLSLIGGRLGLSARGLHRVLKVGRTLADLAGCDRVESPHLLEAASFRLPG